VMEFNSKNPSATIESAIKTLRERSLVLAGDPIVILSDVLHDDLIVDSILLRQA
jgi:pyruvate kinase